MRRNRSPENALWMARWIIVCCLIVSCGLMPGKLCFAPAPVRAQEDVNPLEIWDMTAIQDPTTLDAEIVAGPVRKRSLGVALDVSEVTFNSIDLGDGPIRIHGFVAVPLGHPAGSLPGLVYGHGAGDEADEEIARDLAAMIKAVTISFSGPGQGRSTGPPSTPENWLNTIPDVRGSWLYQYVYSAMRAVTYLMTRPEVDPRRIGMTGISAGGLMTLIANGVDDRLAAAYPIMATGNFRQSLESGSWLNAFPIGDEGLTADSPEVLAFERYLDPIQYADRQHAPVLLINGAQDEFFPINTTRSTYLALRAPEKRLEVIFDWDHGYYAGSSGMFDTYNNTPNAAQRIFGDARAWFRRHLADGPSLPPIPEVSVIQRDGESIFTVARASARGARAVRLLYSDDGAYTFHRLRMSRQSDGSYQARLPGDVSELVYFVEVQWPGPLFLASVPHLPEGFTPRIRPPL